MSLLVTEVYINGLVDNMRREMLDYCKARNGVVYMSPAAVQGELHTIMVKLDNACVRHDHYDFRTALTELATVCIFSVATNNVGGFNHVRELLEHAAMIEGKSIPVVSKEEGKRKHETGASG